MNPFFNLITKPAISVLDDGTEIDTGRTALINEENYNVVGLVSDQYKVVENKEIANVAEEAFSDLKIKKTVDHINSKTSRWMRSIILEDSSYTFEVENDDLVSFKIDLYNGYDGKTGAGYLLSAWRQICDNGLMGWKKQYGFHFHHLTEGIVDKIRESLDLNINMFSENITIWEEWAKVPFDEEDFRHFIENRTKYRDEDSKDGYNKILSEKQTESIKSLYPEIKNRFNERDTKWGAYNILTAIASHYTKARKGSYIFSNPYKRIQKLCQEFYTENSEPLVEVEA